MNGKLLTQIVTLLTLIAIVFGAYFYLEKEFARAEELQQTNKMIAQTNNRLDYKIKQDQLDAAQQRQYRLEDRYENKKMPDTVKEEYRDLQTKQQTLKQELNKLETVK